MAETHFEYAVMNYLGNIIGDTTTDESLAEFIRDQNQQIANRVGDRHYNYRVVKRRVTVGRWIDA